MKFKQYFYPISLYLLIYVSLLLINENKCDLSTKINKKNEIEGERNRDNVKIYNKHKRDSSRMTRRGATALKGLLWDDAIIPYEISPKFKEHEISLIRKAMKQWELFTCLQFVEKEHHKDYIFFTQLSYKCSSYVGKQGIGAQYVSLGPNCTTYGNILHELGHVIGFWHEHARPDRDQYVHVNTINVPIEQRGDYRRLTVAEINSLGEPYDYNSIMQYNNFGEPYMDVIKPITRPGKKTPKIGQREKLSKRDINQANLLYNCPVCGTTLNASYGSLDTLFEASSDEIGLNCEWRIHAAKCEKIILNITEYFLLRSNNCTYDYLQVRDGYSHDSPILGHYCGSTNIPTILSSTSNYLLVQCLRSFEGLSYFGFQASYQTICGGDIQLNAHGQIEIQSPYYPENYEPNKECIWRIYAPENHWVFFEFQSFEIENSKNCTKDYLEFRDGNNSDSVLIDRYCKSPEQKSIIQSTGNQLFIKFKSDGSNEASGFSAFVSAEINECKTNNHGCDHDCVDTLIGFYCTCRTGYDLHQDGKTCIYSTVIKMTELIGVISSPNFPNLYPNNIDYTWHIVVPQGLIIILRFSHFEIEDKGISGECNDYIEINNLDGEYQLIDDGIFCGSTILTPILIEGNEAEIFFSTNKEIQKPGFFAHYVTKLNECITNNGGCEHTCRNTINAHECFCYDDYTLENNGYNCTKKLTTPKKGCPFSKLSH